MQGMVDLLLEYLESRYPGQDLNGDVLYVSVKRQALFHVREQRLLRVYPVATAKAGLGGTDGSLRQAHPITMDPSLVGEAGEALPSRQSFRLARSLGKPVYSKAYPYFTDDWQFEVHVHGV